MVTTKAESRGELWRRTKSVMLSVLVCIPPKVVVWRLIWYSVFVTVSVCFIVANVSITREIEFRNVHPAARLDFELDRGWNRLKASRGLVYGNDFSKTKCADIDELQFSNVNIYCSKSRLVMPPKATDYNLYNVSIGDDVEEVYFTQLFSGDFTDCNWVNKIVLDPGITRINSFGVSGTGNEPVDRLLANLQHTKFVDLYLGRVRMSSVGIDALANTSIRMLRIDCEKLSPNDIKTLLASASIASIALENATIGAWVDEFSKYASKHAGTVILSDESPESEIYHKLDRKYSNIMMDVSMP